ncbi:MULTISPECIES: 2OG-Fe(II) oxygenase [Prochlorococcus]|uniref:2OG-Fe(II) oxygenase n=1 Tax=Prochlorococcus TaxID=1218 RepID=UPI0007B3F3D8|nr:MULTISPECIES: 2OG-Fe(II) oxygenase [Prochlorococcus]KZR66178.1 hypothetical protein PMIT1312_01007 [Prochlorococcus marinus str. MIT 1312]KZR83010.1 hypothetical protein PMIT1327_00667 [Prochlorococcus marinus str. MIT 1327]NMP05484.1 2OG-Fe(II) oxygenase [Prochlorococcus sp. P1361]NMP13062.1 2OG-Fe(II) oxygenase [Prochlorococcus sp.P1363]
MKRIALEHAKQNPSFMGAWMLPDPSICEELVSYFEQRPGQQRPGTSGLGKNNTEVKDSMDMSISPAVIAESGNEVLQKYFQQLFHCYNDYSDQWPFLKEAFPSVEIGSFNLQKYKPGQHFKNLHTERTSIHTLHRLFAFMTYLNTIDDGGSTHFHYYDLDIQPKKGLTLIWPAEWTHLHRGNPVINGIKYIITGWMNIH